MDHLLQDFRPSQTFFGVIIVLLNETGKTSSASDLLTSHVMNGVTVSTFCFISRDGAGSKAQVFPSDFFRRTTTSSVVTGENESIVVDAVGAMSGGLAS